MTQNSAKKTVNETTTAALLKTARIVGETLRLRDKYGSEYTAHRTAQGKLQITLANGSWRGLLLLDEWSDKELAWWEAKLDALSPPHVVYLALQEKSCVVLGHLTTIEACAAGVKVHPFRVNNAARQALPPLGTVYVVPRPPERPRMTRGASMRA
jgi:hypothetical protein